MKKEIEIPEGYEARIEGNKIILELKDSEDERIRKLLVWQVHRNIEDGTNDLAQSVYDGIKGHDPDLEESIEDWKKCLAYLEKQKEQKSAECVPDSVKFDEGFKTGREIGFREGAESVKLAEWSEEDKRRFDSCMRRLAATDGTPTINSSWFEDHCSKHSHWKPSEEQIGALSYAYWELFKRKDVGYNILGPLQKLYNELKQLM